MNIIKKKIIGLLFILPYLLTLPSCIDDHFSNQDNDGGCTSNDLNLVIRLPEVETVSNLSTRSNLTNEDLDFNIIHDMNIIIYSGANNIPQILYYDKDDSTYGSQFPLSAGDSLILNSRTKNSPVSVVILGNYGQEIQPTELIKNGKYQATYLRDTKVLNLAEDKPIPDRCIFYGDENPSQPDPLSCYQVNIRLVRQIAKTTIGFRNDGIYDGIEITPFSIGVHNIATTSNLSVLSPGNMTSGERNQIGRTGINGVLVQGDPIGYSLNVSYPSLHSQTPQNMGFNYHHNDQYALYFFENNQQEGGAGNDERERSTDDMENATYISVKANYKYRDNGTLKSSGVVTYKYCLGTAKSKPANYGLYDVYRDYHYKVTLCLSQWAGAVEGGYTKGGNFEIDGSTEGVTWRVDMDLDKEASFSETEKNFDSHATEGFIEILKDCKIKVTYPEPEKYGKDWIAFIDKNNVWQTLTEGEHEVKKGKFNYYIMPWKNKLPNSYSDSQERTCSIEVTEGTAQNIILRQWAPIKIKDDLYMERFEDAPLTAKWGTASLPVTFEWGENARGWDNTILLNTGGFDAAENCLKKGGEILFNSNGYKLPPSERLKYYIPNVKELEQIMEYKGNTINPDYYFHKPEKGEDYWTSSIKDKDNPEYVTFWKGSKKEFINNADERGSEKRVRCVFQKQ